MIFLVLVLATVNGFLMLDLIYVMTSGGPGTATELISLHLYKVFFAQNNLGYGAMLSVTVILMVVSFLLVSRRATQGGKEA